MLATSLTIARYTVLEALRNRLLWLLALAALAALGVAGLAGQLALTESGQIQAALLAALLRLAAVFLSAAFVVTGMAREAADKGLEWLLALPAPRAAYLLGKLGGFCLLALLPAVLFGALCLLSAPAGQCALWAASLLCELWIVAAFCLLCALGLQQAPAALAAAGAFYVLARSIGTLQLLGRQDGTPAHRLIGRGIDLLAALLPRLDTFTRTEWLVYHSGEARALLPIAAQTLIWVSLLAGAALFDLYRKEI